jgi:hypothetical protein
MFFLNGFRKNDLRLKKSLVKLSKTASSFWLFSKTIKKLLECFSDDFANFLAP